MERVLDNLLSNAIKYSPDGGPIEIVISREQHGDEDWIAIEVRDKGIGIADMDQSTVFDRFARTTDASEQAPGSGIGLAGVKQIVEQHGGTIGVESEEGKGSRFRVKIPRVPPSAASSGRQ
jgi:signal transduction histidine kinase